MAQGLRLACSGILGLICLAQTALASAPDVVFVVDCSAAMSAELGGPDSSADSGGPITLMDAAKETLLAALDDLASDGSRKVAIWLFGHRLAWSEGDSPELLEQAEYLEQTLGFKVLSELMPGDDVELAWPSDELEPIQLEPLSARLGALKAWGEEPAFLALERALDSLPRHADSRNCQVIVLSGGRNVQTIGKHKAAKDDVAELLRRRAVPVHLVSLATQDQADRQSEAEFRQIAVESMGSFCRVASVAELDATLKKLLQPPAVEDVEARTPQAQAYAQSIAGQLPFTPVVQAPPPPRRFTIEGRVIFYGKPVRRATVTLEGGDLPSVTTKEDGRFVFDDIPPGKYEVRCEAIVKNLVRETMVPLRLDPETRKVPDVDLQLE